MEIWKEDSYCIRAEAETIYTTCIKDKKEPAWLQTQKCLILWRTEVRHEGKAVKLVASRIRDIPLIPYTLALLRNPCALSTRDLPSSKRWEISSL